MAELASLMYEKGDLRKPWQKLIGVFLFSVAFSFGALAVLRLFGRLIGLLFEGVGFAARVRSLGLDNLLWFTVEWWFVAGLIAFVFFVKFMKDMTRLGDKFFTGKHTPMDMDMRNADAFSGLAYATYDGFFAGANYVFSQSAVKNVRTLGNLALFSLLAIVAYAILVIV